MSKHIRLYTSQEEYDKDSGIKGIIPRIVCIENGGRVNINVVNKYDYTIVADETTNPTLFNIAKTNNWIDNESSGLTVYDCQKVSSIKDIDFTGLKSFIEFDNFISVTEIPDSIFSDITTLNEIKLPSSIKKIGDRSFSGTSITEIDIPESVTDIGNYCFNQENITIRFYGSTPPNFGYNWANKNTHILVPKDSLASYRHELNNYSYINSL